VCPPAHDFIYVECGEALRDVDVHFFRTLQSYTETRHAWTGAKQRYSNMRGKADSTTGDHRTQWNA